MRPELLIPFLLLPLSTFAMPISSRSSPDTPLTFTPSASTKATVSDENERRNLQRRGWGELFRSTRSKPAPKERSVDADENPPYQQDPATDRRRKLPLTAGVSLTKLKPTRPDFNTLRNTVGFGGKTHKIQPLKSEPLPKGKQATLQENGPSITRRGLFSKVGGNWFGKPKPKPVSDPPTLQRPGSSSNGGSSGKSKPITPSEPKILGTKVIGDKAFYLNNPKPKLLPLTKAEKEKLKSKSANDAPTVQRPGSFSNDNRFGNLKTMTPPEPKILGTKVIGDKSFYLANPKPKLVPSKKGKNLGQSMTFP